MDAATRAVLNETETLLIEETSREALAALDEDAAIDLETRIRRRGPGSAAPAVPAGRTGDRALRNPASERDRAGTLATGARQQARRDSKRAGSR